MKITKRDGRIEDYDSSKIVKAISQAMKYGSGIYIPKIAQRVADEITDVIVVTKTLTIFQIENMVFHKLVELGEVETAKAYEGYRAVQEHKRKENTTDKVIEDLLNFTNKEVMEENSNKNARIISTQRDLIAGEVSKDLAKRKLIPPHLVQAHDEGLIHIHDLDYIMQPMINCCLPDIENMLKEGTVMNGKQIRTPRSFRVFCTVVSQIAAQIASMQYGGQSINGIDRIGAPYARISYEKYYNKYIERGLSKETAAKFADEDMRQEITDGIQTLQYQINTLMTTNGQSPFITLLLHFEEGYEYEYEAALIQVEILKQRLEGIENEVGIKSTPAFPKLIYVLDEHNAKPGSKYYHITELAAYCSAKRMYPDYISAKNMRKIYEGNVFAPMGCRAFLTPWKDKEGKYKFDGRFNFGVQTINLPNIALSSKGDEDLFWKIFYDRMELIKEMALVRYNMLKDVPSDVSPIHWQHGAIARLDKGQRIGEFLKGGYSTVTIGYIGLYETTKYMKGVSHTDPKGREFALKVMKEMSKLKDKWSEEFGIQFALYGTPAENTAGRLAEIDRKTFGDIEDITDKGYYTNSYHVDVREDIDAFTKLEFESDFQEISTGGSISYVEIPNMNHNVEAVLQVIDHIYETNVYAELNTKSDNCHMCKYEGEMIINDDLTWECPQCHNKNQEHMTVVRRTCGYLGENFWSEGRTKDIKDRVLHL